MIKKVLHISLIVIISFSSCVKEETEIPESVLLKSKTWYQTINDEIPIMSSVYEYDADDRLEYINHYRGNTDTMHRYESFGYNGEHNIETRLKFSYANDSIGWMLTDSTYYHYENGELIQEETIYPLPNSYHVSYHYEYENSEVSRKCRYDNQQIEYCFVYEYADGVCVKETRFGGTNLDVVNGYTTHSYEEDRLIKSEKYTSQNNNFQIITYKYDDSGNLIVEESVKTDFTVVAPVAYVYRYEYYQ